MRATSVNDKGLVGVGGDERNCTMWGTKSFISDIGGIPPKRRDRSLSGTVLLTASDLLVNLPCSPPRFPVIVWPTKHVF